MLTGVIFSSLAIQIWKFDQYANLYQQNRIKKIWKVNKVCSDGEAPECQWRLYKKIIGSIIIKNFLKISLRPEGILHPLCKFYTACKDSVNVSIIW